MASSLQTPMTASDCSPVGAAVVDDGPFLPLLLTVFTSILEVFILCLAGYILAWKGILDKRTQKQLNRLNVSLFTPSLLFSKVAFFLSPEKLKELWIIPIFFVLVTSVSMGVAFVLGWVFRVKRSQRNFAMAAAMFMNSNSLPIALMQSLVVTVHGLKWGTEDNKNAMLGRALTYLVLYSTLGMVLRWSYGVRLLAQADEGNGSDANARPEEEQQTSALPQHHLEFPSHEGTLRPTSLVFPDATNTESRAAPRRPDVLKSGHARRQSRFYNSFPNSPNQSRLQLPEVETRPNSATHSAFFGSPESSEESESDGEAENAPLMLPTTTAVQRPEAMAHARRPSHRTRQPSTTETGYATFRRFRRRVYRAWVALNEFMTVPLWAALASVIVACVGPIQHALQDHMQPVKGALTSAGNCSIPLTLVVLGGYFYPEPPANPPITTLSTSRSENSLLESVREMFGKQKQRVAEGTAPPARRGETKTVVIAVLARMVVTPMLLLPLMALSARFNIHAILDDPVFVVSNVLLLSAPPALTLAQITQAASGDAFERLISRTIFWAYCVVTPPATVLYVILGLMLSKL